MHDGPSDLIACSECDALYHAVQPKPGERGVCVRCHHVLIRPRRFAGMRIIMMAATMLILMGGAVFFPFLRIEAQGFAHSTSILDAALAFGGGRLELLAIATVALILLIPALRMVLLLYVLVPVVFDREPMHNAKAAFRLSEALKPWSMTEIFALGCAVALVKVGDLARIEFGPAFWMFAGLVIVVVIQESFVCSWSIWNSLDRPGT
ncbi:paraquat-inducible protein A [Phaeovulum sp.]|uniref:paraquat-inducible protein A n=1 Tax=Phaeovulum sp. TaxID=2934796 RepID=UPI0035645AFD